MTYIDQILSRPRQGTQPSLLARLSEILRIRRDRARMSELDEAARRDMGLPSDPDRLFLQSLKSSRWTPRDPSGW